MVKPNVFGQGQAYANLMTEDLQAVHQKLSLSGGESMSGSKPYTPGALRAAKRIQRLMTEFAEKGGHNHIMFDEEACAEIITHETCILEMLDALISLQTIICKTPKPNLFSVLRDNSESMEKASRLIERVTS